MADFPVDRWLATYLPNGLGKIFSGFLAEDRHSNRVAGRTSRPARFQFATDSDQSTVYDRAKALLDKLSGVAASVDGVVS